MSNNKVCRFFCKDLALPDGLRTWCKDCCLEETRKRYTVNKKTHKNKKLPTQKGCACCNHIKPGADFCISRCSKDGLNSICKLCVAIIQKRDLPKIRQRTFKKYHTDPVFRMSRNLRGRMLLFLKNESKSASSAKLLGCTGEVCMAYLETLFWPGMTRENMGRAGWAVDHIVPLDAFDRTELNWQFKAFHYTNLQPLWFVDNGKKGARLDWSPSESKYELPERLKFISQSLSVSS